MKYAAEDSNGDLSPASPTEEFDLLSPVDEEPAGLPGLNGTPVHCKLFGVPERKRGIRSWYCVY
jgi:hypothetical protein